MAMFVEEAWVQPSDSFALMPLPAGLVIKAFWLESREHWFEPCSGDEV
jgi:hypothetical protein